MSDAATVGNIGRKGVDRRLMTGVVSLLIGIGGLAVFVFGLDVHPAWRLTLAPAYFMACLCILQAREKT